MNWSGMLGKSHFRIQMVTMVYNDLRWCCYENHFSGTRLRLKKTKTKKNLWEEFTKRNISKRERSMSNLINYIEIKDTIYVALFLADSRLRALCIKVITQQVNIGITSKLRTRHDVHGVIDH